MNILIIKHGSLGDIFLSVGAIQSIRQHYPDAKLFLLTQSNYKNILNKFPAVDTILEDNRDQIILSISKILGFVNKHQINLVIDLQNSSRTQFYNFFIKYFTKAKILSARKFSSYMYYQKPLGLQHITDNHKDQLGKIGINYYQTSNLNWMGLTSFGRWAWRFGRVCLAQRWVPNRISDRRLCHRMEHAALSAVFHWPSQRPGRPAWRYYCAVYPWRYWPIHNDR